ncbi:ABC transporter permease [Pararobbsia alpina]|uniref:Autoinducer 2 import system permease protein LsrD n=1 Tax=Pararobbsia alpina TaxID=621374 RepID=A0A6S7CHG3_9BURK|nr:ABC transporter permease [Pararobbsia alpina]CAB3780187.1 Galactoside transport system permease protein MglC [Pararobbsia alpina]
MRESRTHTQQQGVDRPGSLARQSDERGSIRIQRETISAIAVYLACIVALLLSKFINPEFGSLHQLQTILMLASFLIVCSFGQGLTILIGGLDLSVPSLITLGGVLTASWMGGASPDAGAGWQIPVILAVCACTGAFNGVGIIFFKVPPFIMTLASGIVVYSLCLGATGGNPSGASPHALSVLMSGRLGGMPIITLFTIAFCVLAVVIQGKTTFGRSLYAIGSNPVAAHIAGIRVGRLTILTYVASATFAGFVGMMLVGYSNGATLRMGEFYLLPSIAAVVIGGSSILGGRGAFLGTLGGAILLTILDMIITSLGLEQGWRTMIEGALILAAVVLQHEKALDAVRTALRKKRNAQ